MKGMSGVLRSWATITQESNGGWKTECPGPKEISLSWGSSSLSFSWMNLSRWWPSSSVPLVSIAWLDDADMGNLLGGVLAPINSSSLCLLGWLVCTFSAMAREDIFTVLGVSIQFLWILEGLRPQHPFVCSFWGWAYCEEFGIWLCTIVSWAVSGKPIGCYGGISTGIIFWWLY